jgi:hypothetical protein
VLLQAETCRWGEEKKIDPSNRDCASCGTSGAKLTCEEGKVLARQHINAARRVRNSTGRMATRELVAPSMNSAPPAAEAIKVDESSGCPICLDFLSQGALCTLPYKHEFHRAFVEELLKHGVLQACPLSRTALPDEPEKLFEDATQIFVALRRKVERKKKKKVLTENKPT